VIDAAREYLEHGVDGLGRGDAQSIDEAALNTALSEVARHLFAASVYDN